MVLVLQWFALILFATKVLYINNLELTNSHVYKKHILSQVRNVCSDIYIHIYICNIHCRQKKVCSL